MNAPILAAALLAVFAGLNAVGERLRGKWRWAPLGLFAAGLAVAGMEFARYDHGHSDWLLWIGFVGAPIVVIFGGAAWGVRRWYGWPDWGPVPGRLALVTAALLAGILAGSSVKSGDVEESMRRGNALAEKLRLLGHGKSVLPGATSTVPGTAMGLFDPPDFELEWKRWVLTFPIGSGRKMILDLSVPPNDAKWRVE